ncbi:MAG: hypothetical protein LBQ57_07680 [Spirochaetales bacterium]|jgi:hypothetical protein|nr:hypothetical protein [Spirochaetales bacterium]
MPLPAEEIPVEDTPAPEVLQEEAPAQEVSPEEAPAQAEELPAEEKKEKPIDPALYNIVSHIMDDEVLFAIDPGAGVSAGDLYTLVRGTEEIGLLLVNEVREKFAVARLISFGVNPLLGDELRAAARAGVEATAYGGSFLKSNFSQSYIPLAGLKLVLSRGFFYSRPVLEIEFPFARAHTDLRLSGVVPFNILAGAELTNLYFGRFQLASVMLLGMGWAYMNGDAQELFDADGAFQKTHFSGKAFLSLSCLVSRHLKITADAGILALIDLWSELSEVEPGGYFGRKVAPFVTLGLTLR